MKIKLSKRSNNVTKSGIRSFSDGKIDFNLTVGQPDFKVPPKMIHAVKKAMKQNKNGYIKTGGESYIRQLLADNILQQHPTLGTFEKDFGIVITSGVTGALYCSVLACCDVGEEVLLADPYFSPYLDMVKLAGAKPVLIDTYPELKLTAASIQKAITEKTRLIILNSPNNPAGTIIEEKELAKIVKLCTRHDITIISDEIYLDYCYSKQATSILDMSKTSIVLRGFSKSCGATGWRIGYLIAPLEIASAIETIQGKIYVSAPSITHYAIPAAIKCNPDKQVKMFKKRRDGIIQCLSGVFKDIVCDGGMFMFLNVKKACGLDADQFVKKAAERGVALLPGRVFSKHNTHCRISLTCDTRKLLKAIQIIKEISIENNTQKR